MRAPVPSLSQYEALGRRLRDDALLTTDADLIDEFFQSYEPFASNTYSRITSTLVALPPANSGIIAVSRRKTKTLPAITEKLRRISTTLPQIDDIVGCRIVVSDRQSLGSWAELISKYAVPGATIKNRIDKPSHGYRAIHLIQRHERLRFEVQIRTQMQHTWASLVEKLAGKHGIEVKYGGGNPELQEMLQELAALIDSFEAKYQFLRTPELFKTLIESKEYRETVQMLDQVQERFG